ncbi:hypothetical protein Tco_1526022 [Tanacetum coccineum]
MRSTNALNIGFHDEDISPFHLPGRKRRRSESQQQRRTRRVVARRSATHGMAAENLESDSTRSQGNKWFPNCVLISAAI